MTNFNTLPMNGPAGLREVANKTYGIKNVRQYGKDELVQILIAAEAEREGAMEVAFAPAAPAIDEKAAKKAEKAAKKAAKVTAEDDAPKAEEGFFYKPEAERRKGICTAVGCNRRQDKTVLGPELCTPHLEEGGWENTHSDEGHGVEGFEVAEELTQDCWICHPELNKAAMKVTTGTSRSGMVMNVSVRAAGETKAAQVIEKIAAKTTAKTSVESPKKEDLVLLTIRTTTEVITIGWTKSGACLYERISIVSTSGKVTKARNVAAVLRHLGVIA